MQIFFLKEEAEQANGGLGGKGEGGRNQERQSGLRNSGAYNLNCGCKMRVLLFVVTNLFPLTNWNKQDWKAESLNKTQRVAGTWPRASSRASSWIKRVKPPPGESRGTGRSCFQLAGWPALGHGSPRAKRATVFIPTVASQLPFRKTPCSLPPLEMGRGTAGLASKCLGLLHLEPVPTSRLALHGPVLFLPCQGSALPHFPCTERSGLWGSPTGLMGGSLQTCQLHAKSSDPGMLFAGSSRCYLPCRIFCCSFNPRYLILVKATPWVGGFNYHL